MGSDMDVVDLRLAGLKLVRPRVFADERGFLLEGYNARRYADHGIGCAFVQDNHSRSKRGILRGLHYQDLPGQAKLVRAAQGAIFDVAVDIRPDSPTFGEWEGVTLDDRSHHQLFIPVGFAHGFCVTSDSADVVYKVSSYYDPEAERGLAYDDPDLGIEWPVPSPLVSERDRVAESWTAFRRRVAP
jgi:dTDP-4-dehydrorhamnose 3,5-epimerase